MEKSRYKKSKMGCLPGDVWKGIKIAMLEDKLPGQGKRSKSYRKEQHKKANRRFRHEAEREIEEGT
jgi:hypothetical protein